MKKNTQKNIEKNTEKNFNNITTSCPNGGFPPIIVINEDDTKPVKTIVRNYEQVSKKNTINISTILQNPDSSVFFDM